jgi:hypothetical protein
VRRSADPGQEIMLQASMHQLFDLILLFDKWTGRGRQSHDMALHRFYMCRCRWDL